MPPSDAKKLTVGSLFAGIGGFDLAAERAGLEVKWQVEIDDFATRVLEKHWPDVRRYRDVRECEFEPADIICGGFPCQDISGMGHRAGLAGERSGLWREMLRAVRVVRPRYVVVENVASLLSRGMGEVQGNLADIGYDTEWDCLPAHAFGVRQSRSRVFVLAHPHRGIVAQPHERAIVPSEVPPAPVIGDQPLPGGMRTADGTRAGVDIGRRISACANAVVPQVTEWIFRRIVEAEQA